MVCYEHEVPRLEGFVDAAGSIGLEKIGYTQHLQGTQHHSDVMAVVAFVEMEAAVQQDHILILEHSENKAADVARCSGDREVGYRLVRNLHINLDLAGERAQT